jgi:anti-anti-sigma factor
MPLAESLSVSSHRGRVAFRGRDADRAVVWIHGEHDVSTVAALSATLARAIAVDDADLVVDLSGVQFMGAATVGVIIRARDFLGLRSRSLTLRSPSTCAARLLDMCGLADLVELSPDAAVRPSGADARLSRLTAVPAAVRVDPASVDEGDLQQLARRADVGLLSLIRLGERNHDRRVPLAKKTAAHLRMSRTWRTTPLARPT